MPLVNVMVNQRAYTIACDEGEEEHLKELAEHVDGKVRELLGSVGQVGDARLLLMAALLVTDDPGGPVEVPGARDQSHVAPGFGASLPEVGPRQPRAVASRRVSASKAKARTCSIRRSQGASRRSKRGRRVRSNMP